MHVSYGVFFSVLQIIHSTVWTGAHRFSVYLMHFSYHLFYKSFYHLTDYDGSASNDLIWWKDFGFVVEWPKFQLPYIRMAIIRDEWAFKWILYTSNFQEKLYLVCQGRKPPKKYNYKCGPNRIFRTFGVLFHDFIWVFIISYRRCNNTNHAKMMKKGREKKHANGSLLSTH